jgi:branched-chain amino acid transport system permease protein
MERFILFTVNGLAFGAIYASVALALVIIWRSTRILNFAQGAQAAASAYIAWTVTDLTGSFWLGLVAALVSGLVMGALVQLLVFRTGETMPQLNTVIVGIGLLILIEAVLGMLYPIERTRRIGTAFSDKKFQLDGVPLVSSQDLFVIGSVLATMAALGLLMTKTPIGLRLRATAFAPDTARLMGVKVPRMLILGWALAGLAGALAAMLVIPTAAELVPQVMDGVFVLGFTAAVVGGLDSPVGAVVGGLACGLVLSYSSGYLSADLLYPAALVLLVVVLLVKPEGLFNSAQARRV